MTSFDASLYGVPSNDFLNHYNSRLQELMSSVNASSNSMVLASTKYMDKTYTGAQTIEDMKDAQLGLGINLNIDNITYLSNPMNAKPVMQYYIMSNPEIQDMYNERLIHGYESTINIHRNSNDLEDYTNATISGVLSDYGPEHPSEYISDVDSLTFSEQTAIQDTWTAALKLIADGIDITEI